MQELREFIERVILETRKEDLEKIRMATNSFIAIVNYVGRLNKNVAAYNRVFIKDDGYFLGIALGAKIRRNEHTALYVEFRDRKRYGAPDQYMAAAQLAGKTYRIYIYLTAPEEVSSTPRLYNQWLAKNLDKILSKPSLKSYYVHEFIHILDYKRMDIDYLYSRPENQAVDDFPGYANAPLEINAYFSQGIADVKRKLSKAQTPEDKEKILGKSPQEFAEKFLNIYLKQHINQVLTPDNRKRLMKRAATTWELLK